MEPLCVIPFFAGDRHLVAQMAPWMRRLSGGKRIGSKLLLCISPTTRDDGMSALFSGLFDEIKVVQQTTLAKIPEGGRAWPRACNHQFLTLAKHICEERSDIEAFYYFEPDCLPLRRDWWQKVCAEYASCGKPFWGIQAPNVEGNSINGHHMIGTGIYPRDAWNRIAKFREIDREQPDGPWDVLAREEVNPQCHFTKLAIHYAGLSNYQPDGYAIYPKHFEGSGRYKLDIPDETCVFHGCKDSSLHDFWGIKIKLPPLR